MICSTQLFGQSQQNSQDPLSPEEKRQILGQLYELRSCRDQVKTYEQFVSRDQEQDAREKANFEKALELEKQSTTLAMKERDLAQEKANLYEQLYRSVAKKPEAGCRILRVVTLGIARCK
jgi:hypothetical protein